MLIAFLRVLLDKFLEGARRLLDLSTPRKSGRGLILLQLLLGDVSVTQVELLTARIPLPVKTPATPKTALLTPLQLIIISREHQLILLNHRLHRALLA